MTPRQFFKKSGQDPYFVARLTDTDILALRAGIAKRAKLGRWFDTTILGTAASMLLFFGSAMATILLLPLLMYFGQVAGALLTAVALVAWLFIALTSLWSPFRSFSEMERALQPLHTADRACHRALKLVTESPVCRAYRDQVLSHPRELVLADLPPMQRLHDEEQTPARMLSAQQACKAVHGLAPLPAAQP